MNDKSYKKSSAVQQDEALKSERGFTLIETSIALVVLMVGALAMASLFVYAIQNNVGGGDRALAMAVAQQHLEQIRSVNFNDATLTVGTTTLPSVSSGGRNYTVERTVANETNSDGSFKDLKKITITVTPHGGGPTWIRSSVVIASQRSTMSTGAYAVQ